MTRESELEQMAAQLASLRPASSTLDVGETMYQAGVAMGHAQTMSVGHSSTSRVLRFTTLWISAMAIGYFVGNHQVPTTPNKVAQTSPSHVDSVDRKEKDRVSETKATSTTPSKTTFSLWSVWLVSQPAGPLTLCAFSRVDDMVDSEQTLDRLFEPLAWTNIQTNASSEASSASTSSATPSLPRQEHLSVGDSASYDLSSY